MSNSIIILSNLIKIKVAFNHVFKATFNWYVNVTIMETNICVIPEDAFSDYYQYRLKDDKYKSKMIMWLTKYYNSQYPMHSLDFICISKTLL